MIRVVITYCHVFITIYFAHDILSLGSLLYRFLVYLENGKKKIPQKHLRYSNRVITQHSEERQRGRNDLDMFMHHVQKHYLLFITRIPKLPRPIFIIRLISTNTFYALNFPFVFKIQINFFTVLLFQSNERF